MGVRSRGWRRRAGVTGLAAVAMSVVVSGCVDLPSFEAGGVLPGVDVSSNRALYDLLDEHELASP